MSGTPRPPAARRAYPASAQDPVTPTQVPRSAVVLPTPRGLTTSGVVVIVLLPTVLAALVETAWHDRLSWIFGALFAIVSIGAAMRARTAALLAAATTPPLAFVAATMVSHSLAGGGSGWKGVALDTVTGLAAGAPFLVPTAVVCAAIAAIRSR